jgi:protein phosphatase PTC7
LGDSRAFIIRGDKFVFRTDEQQHWYDCPYQVGTNSTDTPLKDATCHIVKLLPSDLVVFATDGLGDNLWGHEILSETVGDRPVQDIAERLCARARAVAEDKWGESPFMVCAVLGGLMVGESYYGGVAISRGEVG